MVTKKEAANRLKISVRTLERCAQQGQIQTCRETREGRSVAVYDEKAVAALKAHLDRERRPNLSPPRESRADTETIAFRLDPLYAARLKAEGETRRLSAGEYARRLVIDALEDTESQRVREEVAQLKDKVVQLRGDFATAVAALLVLVGRGSVKPTEAEAWAREQLRLAKGGSR